jgi:hypothetical protein
MEVCILSQDGEVLVQRTMPAAPAPFLQAVAPSRDGLVGSVACRFPWEWRAAWCAPAGSPLVWGHALSMTAMHGGPATNDQSDAPQSAPLRRGGLRPPASVSPAARRAPRDRRRRRMPRMRHRAARLSPVHKTTSPSHWPERGKHIADNTTRAGVAARCAEPAGPTHLAGARALRTADDAVLRDLARALLHTAKPPAATPRSRLQTVPGMGPLRRRVRLDDLPALDRFPSVQDCAAECRRGTWAQDSGGTRGGPSGQQSGHAPRKWAVSEAAVLWLRTNAPGQTMLARWETKHATGTARSLLAPHLGRAVSDLLQRHTACEMARVLRAEGSSAGAPGATRATPGGEPAWSGRDVLVDCVGARHGAPRPVLLAPAAVSGRPLWRLERRQWAHTCAWAAPPPRPRRPGACQRRRQPVASDGRRGPHDFAGAEQPPPGALPSSPGGDGPSRRVWCRHARGAPVPGKPVRTRDRLTTGPRCTMRKTRRKIRSQDQCVS